MLYRYYTFQSPAGAVQLLLLKERIPISIPENIVWLDELMVACDPEQEGYVLREEFVSDSWHEAKNSMKEKYPELAGLPWIIPSKTRVQSAPPPVEEVPENWHHIEFVRFTFPNEKYLEVPVEYAKVQQENLFYNLFNLSTKAAAYVWLVVNPELTPKEKKSVIALSDGDAIIEALEFINSRVISMQVIPVEE